MELLQKITLEIKKIGYLTLFFGVCFGIILLLMKLFLEQYSIELYVVSKVIVGALVTAKVVLIMAQTRLIKKFQKYPRYVSVLYKTILYTLTVFILGILEKLLIHHIPPGIIIKDTNLNHFLAVNLCVAIVFLIYNIFDEIDNYMTKGSLYKLFFSRVKNAPSNRERNF